MAAVTTTAGRFGPRLWPLALYTLPRVDLAQVDPSRDARAEIRGRFGQRVVQIVDGSTDTDQVPKPPWHQRKEAFITQLVEASPSVRLVVALRRHR